MKKKDRSISTHQEVNLKQFFRQVYKNKLFFIASICSFLVLALLYISIATPIYEVSTSILIDSSGSNRVLGESEYVDGGVSLIEMEKNLYNEIGIIKSFSLINQTVDDLDLDISYHSESLLNEKEHYSYFPFRVELIKEAVQLFNSPFEIRIMAGGRYALYVEADDFMVSNPSNGSRREVERDFEFSGIFEFGEQVEHEYFTFILHKPGYDVNIEDFGGDDLSFIVRDIDEVTKSYMSKIDVNNIDLQASIFKIVSIGALVDREIDFLKKLTENYVQNNLTDRNKIASSKEDFIQNQLRIISDSLSKTEMDLESFKKDKKAVNLGVTAMNALDQTKDLKVEQAKIQLDIKYYNSLIQDVKRNQNSDDFVIPSGSGIDDPSLNMNIMELQRLYAERSRKKFFVTSNNEEMSILNKQIEQSTKLLLDNLRNAVKSARFELQRVNSQLANYDEQISSLPTSENQLVNIQRQSTLYENLFNYLSQELAKTGIARAESTSDTRVLDEARMTGDGPVAPQKSLLMVLALVLGTIPPLAWIVFSPKNTIENIGQIMANSDIPIIASIVHYDSGLKTSEPQPLILKLKEVIEMALVKFTTLFSKRRKGKGEDEVYEPNVHLQKGRILFDGLAKQLKLFGAPTKKSDSEKPESDILLWKIKESFRDLTTNLRLVNGNKSCVLGITSIMPEEGKTFTSINLGITLAEAGNKTLIIDADLRKPSLVDGIRKVEGRGLSNYLKGDIDSIYSIVYPHERLKDLDFIPTSVLDGNAHKSLSSDRMKSLILELRDIYDYIILDTPAVGLVSDFLLLWDLIDINLFVVRRKIAKIQFLEDFEQMIPKDRKKKNFIVFNDALKENHKYGYEEKYGLNREEQFIKESLSV